MKKFICFIGGFIFSVFVSAQCTIDYNYSPVGANYGLNPDSLPNGYVGQFYDEDMTFFLPLDTVESGVSITFEDFHITSISLPLGLTWECDNFSNGCHYDPSVSQYGCVKVSGTPLIPGNYDIQVDLLATHSLSVLTGPENISFILPLTILSDTSTSSNSGFAMTNASGCLPVTVSFSNNNIGMISYFWDFGNGNTSTLAQPADQIYTQPGQYIIQYSAVQTNPMYFLESIEVVNGNCSDNILIGDVDLLYDIFTSSGMVQSVSVNNAITQPFPLMITLSNPLQLTGQDVTIDVWDDDGWPWGLEYCGGLTFTPQFQSGTFAANGGGLTINYTVMEVPGNIISTTDTINVYDYPQPPNLIYDTLNSLIHTTNDSIAMQWYYYNSPIPGATDTIYEPTISGLYSLVIVNDFGCSAISNDVLVVICDSTYHPLIDDNGSTAWMIDSALYSNLQWYDENGPVSGANQSFFPAQIAGNYYIVATDEYGCNYSSETVYLSSILSIENLYNTTDVKLVPNPISDGESLMIYINDAQVSKLQINIYDVFGRKFLEKTEVLKNYNFNLDSKFFNDLPQGIYYLEILFNGEKIIKKIIKS
tara:strand:- start:191 stop:1963 length:1773 start_codon:yes stop_codon:yes gene_type:complete